MDPQTAHQAAQGAPFVAVLGNIAWNTLLIGALACMLKNWMTSTHTKIDTYCSQNREEHSKIFTRLENHSERIAVVEDRTKDL
jgi:hypothetical protein